METDSRKHELVVVMNHPSWVLGNELKSSLSTLSCRAISPLPLFSFVINSHLTGVPPGQRNIVYPKVRRWGN